MQFVLNVGNALYAKLRNVDKSIDSGLKRYERAEGHYANNLAFYYGANGITLIRGDPGLGLKLLIAQRYALLFNVNIPDKNFNFLTNAENLAGLLHAAPGNVGNVDKSVNTAANVNKRAEIGQPAYNALYLGANFQLRPALLAGLLGFFHTSITLRVMGLPTMSSIFSTYLVES